MTFKVCRALLYASVFAPLLVTTSTIYPSVVGPFVWFRCTVSAAMVCFFVGVMFDRTQAERYGARARAALTAPLGISISAFTAIFLLACLFGIDRANSFWSNFSRGQGGLEVLTFYVFLLLAVTLLDREPEWLLLFRCFVAAALLSVGYGVLAGLGVEGFVGARFGAPDFRFAGSVWNAAAFGAYLMFAIAFSLQLHLFLFRGGAGAAAAARLEPTSGARGPRGGRKRKGPAASAQPRGRTTRGQATALVAAPVAVFLVSLLFTAQRGVAFGLAVGALVFSIAFAIRRPPWRRPIIAAWAGGAAVVAAMFHWRDQPAVHGLPFSRVLDVSVTRGSFADRLAYWRMAWDGFLERPLLGFGPENLLTWFQRHFNPDVYKAAFWVGGGSMPDRAHSIVFDTLGTTGLLGTLAYVSMFGAYFWTIIKAPRSADPPPAQQALALALPAAYLGQGMVMFDSLASLLGLFVWFAFTLHRHLQEVAA